MTLRKNIFSYFIMLVCMVLILMGCASKGKDNQNNEANVAEMSKEALIVVSAAASLSVFLDEAIEQFETAHPNIQVQVNYGSSGSLQKQIEQGAPVDLFISAGQKQIDALNDQQLISKIEAFLQNRLVVIAPKGMYAPINEATDFVQWLDAEQPEFIAIGEPSSVPAGTYAAQVMEYLDIWEKWKNHYVYGKDVRQVLSYVEQENATVGIVYASDAMSSDKIEVIMEMPEAWHDSIEYSIAIIQDTKQEEAASLLYEFLLKKEISIMYKRYGFDKGDE